MAERTTISMNLETFNNINEWKKQEEEELGIQLSWDNFFKRIYLKYFEKD